MDVTHVRTLVRAALRSLRYLLGGRVRFPQRRLGDLLETPDGTYLVYRETELRSSAVDASEDRVVLVFRMDVTLPETGEPVREVLSDPLANVATPFFAGMPGFRRKLWLAGERPGAFLELYEWASAEDARRFVAVLQWLLDPFDFAGSASFEVVEDDTVDDYVATHAVAWREATRRGGDTSPRRRPSLRLFVLFVVAVAVSYLLGKRGTHAGDGA
jgi:hypothetical protein